MVKLQITTKKNGRQITWFRDYQGRKVTVGSAGQDWVQARQLLELGLYGIQLQKDQARAGLGSDGSAMPALSTQTSAVLRNGKFVRHRSGYAGWKAAHGLQPVRDLYGPGIGGHMLDSIRVNYISDKEVRYAITTRLDREKANANEKRAPWWGWSAASVRLLAQRAGQIFPQNVASKLLTFGLAGVSLAAASTRNILRKAA